MTRILLVNSREIIWIVTATNTSSLRLVPYNNSAERFEDERSDV